MNLSLMKCFFDTVDDDWRSLVADQLASKWFTGEFDARVFRASANFVCRITSGGGDYYLRFNHSTERDPDVIEGEIRYLQYLDRKGVNVNRPVPSAWGRCVESVSTELGVFHSVLFETVPGVHIEIGELDLSGFEQWGQVLGELHKASAGYRSDIIPSWRDHIAYIREHLPASEEVILDELVHVEAALNKLHMNESNYGLIHYDFELDNICWKDGVPGFMDFDDCIHHWYTADIVYALRDLFDDKLTQLNMEDERFRAFIRGYRSARTISDNDLSHIPLFFRLHRLYSYARISRSIIDGPMDGEPEWVTNLRDKLAQRNKKYKEELETSQFL